jgi:type III secretion protein J
MQIANDTINFRHVSSRLSNLLLFLISIVFLTSCGNQRTIVNGLDEKEANEIIVFLASKRIDATKVPAAEVSGAGAVKLQLFDITVNQEVGTEAMSLLNQAGLPRRRGSNLLEIFGNVGLVPSDLEQKIRYEAGLAEQIASTIRKIDGVLDAEVQISFPQEDPLNPGQYKGKITASVYVKHSGVLDDPNSHLITKIKRLVASSITGLDYDNVTVIPDRARYSELDPGMIGILGGNEEKQYVNVWSIIVAKESVSRFRIVFFSFVLLIFSLLLALVWIGWKIYPLLSSYGGFSELFHLHPIKVKHEPETPPAESTEAEAQPKGEKKEEVDKDVDIT